MSRKLRADLKDAVRGHPDGRHGGRHRDARPPARRCAVCGREFEWRRKWASCWGQVRFCSKRCRGRRLRPIDQDMEAAIRSQLASRRGTICPSEAARALAPGSWQPLMETARSAGRRMAHRGEILVQQGGRTIDPQDLRGPVRFARGPRFDRGDAE